MLLTTQPPDSAVTATAARPLRILFLGESVSLAHVARPARLASWARAAGHDVYFACGAARADVARAEGLTPLSLPTIAAQDFFGRIAHTEFMYRVEELESYVEAETDLIARLWPDLVVSDFRLSAAISCTLTRTPLLSLANAYWCPGQPCRFLPPRAGVFRHLPLWGRKAAVAALRPLIFRYLWGRPVNEARQRFGLAPEADFRRHYTAGEGCAYLDLPMFAPVQQLPAGHFYLGPVLWEPAQTASLGAVGRTRPLVYVSLRSGDSDPLLDQVVQVVTGLECDLVMSGVSADRAAALRRRWPALADRWLAKDMLAPSAFLSRARATLCHGGSGTVYQSLAAGVPVLCLPTNGDQGLVADRAVALGVGRRLEPEHATPTALAAGLAALLSQPGYHQKAGRIGELLQQHDTRQHWLDFLGRTVQHRAAANALVRGGRP